MYLQFAPEVPITTVGAPDEIELCAPDSLTRSPTVAAGNPPTNTVGSPEEMVPPTCGTGTPLTFEI